MEDDLVIAEYLADWKELNRVSNRTGVPIEAGEGRGELQNFKLLGTKLYPLPDKVRTEDTALRVFHYVRDTAPNGEDDLENGWMREFPDLFIAEVGLRLAELYEDEGALRYFARMREEARGAYDEKVAEEEHATAVLSF